MKKALSLLLSLCLLLSLFPLTAFAEGESQPLVYPKEGYGAMLTGASRTIYDALCAAYIGPDGFLNQAEDELVEIDIAPGELPATRDDLYGAFNQIQNGADAFRNDYPQAYWCGNFSVSIGFNVQGTSVTYVGITQKPRYPQAIADEPAFRDAVVKAADSITAAVGPNASAYDYYRAITDFVINAVDYDLDNLHYFSENGGPKDENDTSYFSSAPVFLDVNNHLVVCNGYVDAFKILCDYLRTHGTGAAKQLYTALVFSKTHAWNYVLMPDERWYAVDPTWEDTVGSGNFFLKGSGSFCVDKTFAEGHKENLGSMDYVGGVLCYPSLNPIAYENQTCQLRYVSDGETYTTQTVNRYAVLDTFPENPTVSGRVFAGWYPNANCLGKPVSLGTTVTGDMTLYAKWLAEGEEDNPEEDFYTIRYVDGDTVVAEEAVAVGSRLTLPRLPMVPLHRGYLGTWNAENVAKVLAPIHSDVTIRANYTPIATADTLAQGTYGELNWAISPEGELRISGSGPVNDSSSLAPWRAYADRITSLVVENGITALGEHCFAGLTALKRAHLPKSLQNVGNGVFNGCTALESLTLPFAGATRNGSHDEKSVLAYIFGIDWTSDILCAFDYDPTTGSAPSARYAVPASFRSVTITDQTCLPLGAFSGLSMLQEVHITAPVTRIEPLTVYKSGITKAYFYGTAEAWKSVEIDHLYNGVFFAPEYLPNTCPGHMADALQITSVTCATCAAPGSYNRVRSCIVCDRTISEETVIVPLMQQQTITTYGNTLLAIGHCWDDGEITTQPTISASGLCTYTCPVCHATRTEELPAVSLSFATASVSLKSDLSLNFYVKPELLHGAENPHVVFTKDVYNTDGSLLRTVEYTATTYAEHNGAYVFTFPNLAAREMTTQVTATLCATFGGQQYTGPAMQYSVQAYAHAMLQAAGSDEKGLALKKTLVNLLLYGTAAQTYFGYRTDNLADSILTSADRVLVADQTVDYRSHQRLRQDDSNPVQFYGCSLTLSNRVQLNYYLDLSHYTGDPAALRLDVTADGHSWSIPGSELKLRDDGFAVFSFAELNAMQMRTICTAAVCDASTGAQLSGSLQYSIVSYADQFKEQTTPLAALTDAMIRYGDAAYAYSLCK